MGGAGRTGGSGTLDLFHDQVDAWCRSSATSWTTPPTGHLPQPRRGDADVGLRSKRPDVRLRQEQALIAPHIVGASGETAGHTFLESPDQLDLALPAWFPTSRAAPNRWPQRWPARHERPAGPNRAKVLRPAEEAVSVLRLAGLFLERDRGLTGPQRITSLYLDSPPSPSGLAAGRRSDRFKLRLRAYGSAPPKSSSRGEEKAFGVGAQARAGSLAGRRFTAARGGANAIRPTHRLTRTRTRGFCRRQRALSAPRRPGPVAAATAVVSGTTRTGAGIQLICNGPCSSVGGRVFDSHTLPGAFPCRAGRRRAPVEIKHG